MEPPHPKMGSDLSGGRTTLELMIIDEPGFVPLSKTGAELLSEVFSERYERGSVLVTSNLPFDEWTGVYGSERLTGALLNRLAHHVDILEMNGDSYGLRHSRPAGQHQPAGEAQASTDHHTSSTHAAASSGTVLIRPAGTSSHRP